MFEVTFLGHQGWHFASGGTNVLLDPLLCADFGQDPRGNGFDVFPPRHLDFASCPPIDAVLFSHEHEDHFNIPSIERLDRDIPIFISVRSSAAANQILEELGFRVRPLEPGVEIEIGALRVLPLPQESLGGSHPGEWDSLALYIDDRNDDGSFFTTVDHRPHRKTFEALRQRSLRPALVSYADNEQNHSTMFPWAEPQGDADGSLANELRELIEEATPSDARPEAIIVCANGFAARGDLSWMNRTVFYRNPETACALLQAEFGDLFLAPLPGDVIALRGRQRSGPLLRSTWVTPKCEDEWPARGGGSDQPDSFAPATGKTNLNTTERADLSGALDAFAKYLYGSSLFQETYLLDAKTAAGRRQTMAFVTFEGDDITSGQSNPAAVWAWDPSACTFLQESHDKPDDEFVVGARCWASDLLAVLRAEMPAASLTMGRLAGWNALPSMLRFELPNLLHMYCHPLRAPEQFLELYRALVTGESPRIHPTSRPN